MNRTRKKFAHPSKLSFINRMDPRTPLPKKRRPDSAGIHRCWQGRSSCRSCWTLQRASWRVQKDSWANTWLRIGKNHQNSNTRVTRRPDPYEQVRCLTRVGSKRSRNLVKCRLQRPSLWSTASWTAHWFVWNGLVKLSVWLRLKIFQKRRSLDKSTKLFHDNNVTKTIQSLSIRKRGRMVQRDFTA